MASSIPTRYSFALRLMMLLVMAVGIIAMPGCSGCRQDPDERLADKIRKEKEKQKKKKPKPNFRSPGTAILPGKFPDLQTKTTEEMKEMNELEREMYLRNQFTRINKTKLGHWLETSTPTIANNFDQKGKLNSVPFRGSTPALVPNTEFEFETTRSFSLVKGRWKYLPSTAYLPASSLSPGTNLSASLNVGLATSSGGLPFYTVPISSSQTMNGFQYHMVVLTNRPQQIRYLQFADSIQIPETDEFSYDLPRFYYVVTNQAGNPIPLPGNVLNWTTTAYLIWDDLDPDDLAPDQQQALVDWLHFGGQLILSGPDCLSKFENSFLADYLPAQSDGKMELDTAAFESLNKNWSVPIRNTPKQKRSLLVNDKRKLVGVEFKPHDDANFITGTGDLTIERSIGRGRVVATAFSLTSPAIKGWGSFQSFLNNALLRKPSRRFKKTNQAIMFDWQGDQTSMFDPLLGSSVRFISRDLASTGTPQNSASEIVFRRSASAFDDTNPMERDLSGQNRNKSNTRSYGGFRADPTAGVGGWSDNSVIANSARAGLKSAAGITPPSASLILKMLLVYLVILVPVNWLVFRAMGKVEWAWAAIPLIAIAGAVTVVKIASLDIGFARSNTQVALLEIHDGYHRGHLSQYSALYTSLSTNYAVELDNASGIALPLGHVNGRPTSAETIRKRLTFEQSLTNRTENLQIQSNSTGLLHAEWFQDLGGEFRLQAGSKSEAEQAEVEQADVFDSERFSNLTIDNSTLLNLTSAGVIARDAQGNYYTGWIGDFSAEQQRVEVPLKRSNRFELAQLWAGEEDLISALQSPQEVMSQFETVANNQIPLQQIKDLPSLANHPEALETLEALAKPLDETGELTVTRSQFLTAIAEIRQGETKSLVGNLLTVVLDNLELGKGEIRLLGISREQIGNTRFDPQSTQTASETLVVCHLRQPDLPTAVRDANSILDFTGARTTLTDQMERELERELESFDGTIDQE